MAAELQRLALGLADHVHQAAQRLDHELADRSRCGIHFRRKGRDLDRCRRCRRGRGARSRLAPRTGRHRLRSSRSRESCAAGLGPEVEDQRALGRVEELEQRASAVRQQRRRAPHRIAAGRLDLEHVGAEVGGDLAGERRRQPRQSGTSASFTSTMVKRCKGRESRGHRAMIGASRGFGQRRARATVTVTEGLMAQTGNHKGLQFGIFLAPVPPGGREPHAGHGARHGADRMARRAGLRRGLDRRAPFRRLGDHRLAGSVHRRRHRAHALHPAGLGRDQPAVSPSADGGEPLRAARPHVARPHHAGLRPGRAAVGRLHDGHRSLDPARPHGAVARRPSCSS